MIVANQRIKQLRMYRRLSGKELAGLAGISPSELTKIERQMRLPRTETLQRIAKALDVSTSYLLGEVNSNLSLERALAAESLKLFVEQAGLSLDHQRILVSICETDSAPKTVQGWKELAKNLAQYGHLFARIASQ